MTAAPIEIVYTTVVCIGVLCNAWCLREAVKDRRVVVSKADCSEMAWLIANGNVRSEVVRFTVQLSFLTIGVLALYQPPTVDPEYHPGLHAFVIIVRLGFVASTVMLAINSLLNVRERRRILYLNLAKRRW